jgi:hypothetical protein
MLSKSLGLTPIARLSSKVLSNRMVAYRFCDQLTILLLAKEGADHEFPRCVHHSVFYAGSRNHSGPPGVVKTLTVEATSERKPSDVYRNIDNSTRI